ncbi:MAG: HEAT repeat domain-containing protein [Candidatus Poribacteria bacterium]|nr:HEAT repeat domain-containing protein [Candidatus Poribacteria bacterium]
MQRLLLIPILLCLIACQSQEQQAETLVVQLSATEAARRTEASKALVAMGSKAIDAIIRGLTNEISQIREMSALTLSEIGVPAARIAPALISILADPDENIRVVGSVALQNLGEPAVPYLIDALKAESMEIRLNAAYALGEISTPLDTILPALISTLTDPEWNVRRLVVRALVTIGSPAVESLIQALNSDDPDLRRMAERALSDIGTPEARRAIADAKRQFPSDR